MENSWEEQSVSLQLLRNGFRLLVHECESLDSIFVFFLDLYYIFIYSDLESLVGVSMPK